MKPDGVPEFGYYNLDCMEGMKLFPDKYFDLAIVDPPYFSGPERRGFYGRKVSPIGVSRLYEQMKHWDVPGNDYFSRTVSCVKESDHMGMQLF